ncbi:WxL domain-containing protein [Oceanobacillus halophilus]|uniref:WxL domain-containing protein n=1 Tax=Oceanobacillus halophilus TaxID=930130 RepID=A0A494ZY31_9BACI|nr:WxL domain-containing protein [Oceanobacillus halophilus]RKQ31519.1 WxL domain-containing protein [Oceanobacillus halophilus]
MWERMGFLFIAVIFLTFLLGMSNVDAEGVSKGDSKASISFIEDTDSNDILDPTDPDEPYEPGEGDDGKTDNSGPLSIDYVPKLDFGKQTISLIDKTYHTKNVEPFIQVTDKRGEATGWTVTVSATPFESDDDQLEGAKIKFQNATIVTHTNYVDYGAPIPINNGDIELTTDNVTKPVVYAEEGKGRGSWLTRWFPTDESPENLNDSVSLTVIGGTAKDEMYTSTLTWTLENTPQAPEVEE